MEFLQRENWDVGDLLYFLSLFPLVNGYDQSSGFDVWVDVCIRRCVRRYQICNYVRVWINDELVEPGTASIVVLAL